MRHFYMLCIEVTSSDGAELLAVARCVVECSRVGHKAGPAVHSAQGPQSMPQRTTLARNLHDTTVSELACGSLRSTVFAVGGGNVLQVVCDITIAKESAKRFADYKLPETYRDQAQLTANRITISVTSVRCRAITAGERKSTSNR